MTTAALFKEAFKTYGARRYINASGVEMPAYCQMHDILSNGANPNSHNCIGCNFAELDKAFRSVFKGLGDVKNVQAAFTTYYLWLNLFIERLEFILQECKQGHADWASRYPNFWEIRGWANFCKHPKTFLFSHHPKYLCGNLPRKRKTSPITLDIGDTFVDQYFHNGMNNIHLSAAVGNNAHVRVYFPNPVKTLDGFRRDSGLFFAELANDQGFQNKLKGLSTLPVFP